MSAINTRTQLRFELSGGPRKIALVSGFKKLYDRAKIDLAGQHDRSVFKNYFEPWRIIVTSWSFTYTAVLGRSETILRDLCCPAFFLTLFYVFLAFEKKHDTYYLRKTEVPNGTAPQNIRSAS